MCVCCLCARACASVCVCVVRVCRTSDSRSAYFHTLELVCTSRGAVVHAQSHTRFLPPVCAVHTKIHRLRFTMTGQFTLHSLFLALRLRCSATLPLRSNFTLVFVAHAQSHTLFLDVCAVQQLCPCGATSRWCLLRTHSRTHSSLTSALCSNYAPEPSTVAASWADPSKHMVQAPGVNIESTYPGGLYAVYSGTRCSTRCTLVDFVAACALRVGRERLAVRDFAETSSPPTLGV